ncbi:MAG: acyl-ACP--UDP-N-acetylglucosamine O-acyltransferase [Gemmatimonadota bacterium]|nr:MAG: acyl-ACP--UDP-N-acetylglucosamine O-acyltransferase [Gemmatimonadota bacterium]
MNKIHPTAIVDPKAELGAKVAIGPCTLIEGDVTIGDGTKIGAHCVILGGTRIGRDCNIHHHVILGDTPQDLKYKGEPTTLEIGDRNIIREFCCFHRGTRESMKTVIGSDCFLMAYIHIAHDCRIGNHVILANAVNMGGHTEIHDYANVGGVVAIHQFIKIGCHSITGGGYRVPKDIPPYIKAGGYPLKVIGLNLIGLKRRGFSEETIRHLKKAHHILFRSKLNVSQAVQRLKEQIELTQEVQTIITFIERSERGIIR